MTDNHPPNVYGLCRMRQYNADGSSFLDGRIYFEDRSIQYLDYPSGLGTGTNTQGGKVEITNLAGGVPMMLGWIERDGLVDTEVEELLTPGTTKEWAKTTTPPHIRDHKIFRPW